MVSAIVGTVVEPVLEVAASSGVVFVLASFAIVVGSPGVVSVPASAVAVGSPVVVSDLA